MSRTLLIFGVALVSLMAGALFMAGRIAAVNSESPAGKQAVYEKQLYDSPQQFPRQMAIGTVDAFIRYMDGEELVKQKFIACQHYYYEDAVKDETRESEQW